MKNPINLRFLLASLVTFSLLGVAVYFLHVFQFQRQSAFMLSRARQAKDEKRFQPAVRDYQTYLRMAPKDADAQAELGLLLAELGMKRPASRSLETALRLAPEREDLRKRLAQLDIEMGRYGDAREHLLRLLESGPNDDKLREQLGICQAGGGDDRAAEKSFQKAIELDPARCEPYLRLAAVLKRLDRPREADDLVAKLVAKNPQSAQAHSFHAHFLHGQSGQDKEALAEAEKAVALAPEDFEILLLAANLSTATGDYKKARGYADRAIAAKPALAGGYRAVFQLQSRQGERKEALASLRRGIEKASDPRDLLWDLGLVLIAEATRPHPDPLPAGEGDPLTEAQETVARLRRLPREQAFDPVLIDFLQAEIEAARGRWPAAAKAFTEVAQQLERPDQKLGSTGIQGTTANELLKDVEFRLAICQGHLGDSDAQLAAYRKAAHIDPLWAPARMGVAATLASLGQIHEALEEYRQIGKLKGMATAAETKVAGLLILENLRLRQSQRDWKEADAILARLAQAVPDATEAILVRAEALMAEGHDAEAEKLLTAARDKHLDSVDFWQALMKLAEREQQAQRAVELLDQAEKKFGDCVWIRLARALHLLLEDALVVPPSGGIPPKGGTTSTVGIPPKGGTTSAVGIPPKGGATSAVGIPPKGGTTSAVGIPPGSGATSTVGIPPKGGTTSAVGIPPKGGATSTVGIPPKGGTTSAVGIPPKGGTTSADRKPDVQREKLIAELVKLGENTAKFSIADRAALHRGLALALREAGGLEQAKAQAMLACQADRSNVAAWLLLFELTYLGRDTSAMEKVLDEIRAVAGQSAVWHYGEAVRQAILGEQAQGPQDRARLFDQAFAHLAAAQEQRPLWSHPVLLRARLCDWLGQTDQAIENYVKAIDAGETEPVAVRRAVGLLYSRQRYAEADGMLRHLEQREAVLIPELGRMASEVSMRLENVDRAVTMARQAAAQSNDWADYVWLGQITALLSQRAEANQKAKEAQEYRAESERAFRRAVELSPEVPEAWVGLIRFLALTGQKEQAQAMLAEAVKKIPAEKAAIALGPCYEILGRADEAAAQYQQILAQGGNDPRVLRQVAEFCLRTNKPLEAEKHLKRILSPEVSAKPQDIAWARRTMAGILRARGGYANLQKAVELVGLNLAAGAAMEDSPAHPAQKNPAGGPAAEDLQAQAMLLAGFPQRAKRKAAIAALEKVVASQTSDTADARFALASLYLREKDWPQCNKHMRALLSGHGKEARYVAPYIAMLLDHDELPDAGLWLQRLDELTPGSAANLGFRVEMLLRRQQLDLAIELLRENARRVDFSPPSPEQGAKSEAQKAESRDKNTLQTVSILKSAARLAGQRNDSAAKERLLAEMDNQLKDYAARHPGQDFLRASVRMLQGRADEALALAEGSWPKADARLLPGEFAGWVGSAKLAPEQVLRLDRLLLAVAEKQGRPLAILQVVGDLRMRYRPQDAVEIYREILKRDAENPAALNNLALLLALQKQDAQESLKLIDRAIAIAGPVGAFLDTRAIVLMANGRPQEALADLEEAIHEDPRPNRFFHQALAFWQLGQKKAANDAFLEASNRGLKAEDLVGLERANYEDLARKLAQ